jgi:tRNA (guanine-N7-)-methyltransferase
MKAMLVHPRFLLIYKQFLLPDAVINLKTDDDILYQYTLDLIKGNNLILHRHSCDTRTDSTLTGEVLLPTRFEKHQSEKGKTIKYVAFSLREDSFAGMPLPDFQHLLKK